MAKKSMVSNDRLTPSTRRQVCQFWRKRVKSTGTINRCSTCSTNWIVERVKPQTASASILVRQTVSSPTRNPSAPLTTRARRGRAETAGCRDRLGRKSVLLTIAQSRPVTIASRYVRFALRSSTCHEGKTKSLAMRIDASGYCSHGECPDVVPHPCGEIGHPPMEKC